ncbi:MAG TPA: hypothetical protein VGK57_18495 [Candidatus Binatia bacterium]
MTAFARIGAFGDPEGLAQAKMLLSPIKRIKISPMSEVQPYTKNGSPHAEVQAGTNYGRALRVIGQDLTNLFPKVLEIDTDGMSFEARGESHSNPFERIKEPVFKKVWSGLFHRKAVADLRPTQSEPTRFVRSYNPAEIDRLDRLHSAARTGNLQKADMYSLAERLRIMGAIVDSRNGRFKQLRKEDDRLSVEYWDQDGNLQAAKLTTVIMYRNQRRHKLQRRNPPLELWEGYHF